MHYNNCNGQQVYINCLILFVLHADGDQMLLSVTDRKNETSNSYSVQDGMSMENTDKFCYCFKVEPETLINISNQNVARFEGEDIKYFIALEP